MRGRAYVDASGNANLAAMAGVGERHVPEDERQLASLALRFGGVDPTAGLPTTEHLTAAVSAAGPVWHGKPLPPPRGFLSRLPGSGDLLAIIVSVPADALSSRSLTRAELSARALAWQYLEIFRRQVPGFADAYLVSSGPELGIRQGRSVRTTKPVRAGDARRGGLVKDTIAYGGWPMEIHHPDGAITYEPIGGPGWFGIPYGCLTPVGIDNLWLAGRAIGADSQAYASVRVMGTSFATGQAAGCASASMPPSGWWSLAPRRPGTPGSRTVTTMRRWPRRLPRTWRQPTTRSGWTGSMPSWATCAPPSRSA